MIPMEPETTDRLGLEKQSRLGRRVTWLGLWVSLLLVGAKAAAGHWGHSRALLADAAHSASDLLSDLLVLVGFRLGRAPADEEHPYGHGKVETLVSTLVGLALAAVGVLIAYDAVKQLLAGPGRPPSWWALLLALFSVLAKEVLYRYTDKIARLLNSPLLHANAWHHRSDALSSLAVLAGVAGTTIGPGWWVLDPLAAFVVALMVLKVGGGIMVQAVRELVDTAPTREVRGLAIDCAASVPGVLEVHDLRMRSMAGRIIMELHVVVDGELSVSQGHGIAKEVEVCLQGELGLMSQVTVHVDPA